jgi:hypothetical protein
VDAPLLVAYLVLAGLTYWRSRSVAWTTAAIVGSISVAGVVVNFSIDHVTLLTRTQLQFVLLAVLAVPAVIAWLKGPIGGSSRREQLLGTVVPVVVLIAFFTAVVTWWSEGPGLLRPVGFLMGHSIAEDNAKWLDFGAKLATGGAVDQAVPLGGPLQLYLVFVATIMAVASQILLGGVNEVMVAANTVIMGQFLLVALAPLALSPLVEVKMAKRSEGRVRIPIPFIWLGSLILVLAVLMMTAYGHLTLQWTLVIAALWVGAYLVRSQLPWMGWLTSIGVIALLVVWFPMTVVSIIVLLSWLVVLVLSIVRGSRSLSTWLAFLVTAFVAGALLEPLWSSLIYVAGTSGISVSPAESSGGALRSAAGLIPMPAITDSTLFLAGGGTEVATPILVTLAVLGAVGAAFVVSRQGTGARGYLRLAPVFLLAGFTILVSILDQWATGSAPNYGSLKFTFMAVIVIASITLPLALTLIDVQARGMTVARWSAVGGVVLLLTVDSLLVRSVAAARPEQWSPPIPFDNPQSYWWPAEVNGTAEQPIDKNPVACVYLPNGADAPSAILDSQLSDPQRVYACSRLLGGLAGTELESEPLVAWLRREWLTNSRAWSDVYRNLSKMSDGVLDKPIIILDDGSNVVGIESLRGLLTRFPVSERE